MYIFSQDVNRETWMVRTASNLVQNKILLGHFFYRQYTTVHYFTFKYITHLNIWSIRGIY
jgi:hypothetical protein